MDLQETVDSDANAGQENQDLNRGQRGCDEVELGVGHEEHQEEGTVVREQREEEREEP